MLKELKENTNYTFTENGAVTLRSTQSDCLDLFAAIGALRKASDKDITDRFMRAYAEDADTAMKILFYARDVRAGLGERRAARTILKWLANNHSESVEKNIGLIAEMGRWDDMLVLLNTPCHKKAVEVMYAQLKEDMKAKNAEGVSLLAKWLPSVNTSNAETVKLGKMLAREFHMSEAAYRRTLSLLRARIRIIENNLRERDYTFDYEKQPSKAMFKYRAAFRRNDAERYGEFLDRVKKGEAKLNTGTLTPYDIIAPIVDFRPVELSKDKRQVLDVTWNAQENFAGDENVLVVVDGSASMYWDAKPMPAAVAQSLAIYFAERNKGEFANHFITFSCNPRLVEIKGKDIAEKVKYCMSYNECANTNIQKVFELVLNTAVEKNIPQNEMPERIYIISDMEFDYCTDDASLTNFEYAKKLYEGNGYKLPELVFWNVASRNQQQPVRMNEQGVILVSGSSPRIFSMLKSGTLSPYAFMMEVLGSDRYKDIAA